MTDYVDVHTHLFHERFTGEEDDAARRAADAGVTRVIVNGLEPRSNRQTLELCARHDHLKAALGIYPLDGIAAEIAAAGGWQHPFPPPEPFDVDTEIDFINSRAAAGDLCAIGEIGLDWHWVKGLEKAQERVFRRLIEVGQRHDLPLIIHSRKAERRCLEILLEMGVRRADFHCYGGKLKLAREIAKHGFFFSIPTVVTRAESFQRLAQELPLELLLTETDAPYMGPYPGERNEPATVPLAVAAIAGARGEDEEQVATAIWANFQRLFGDPANASTESQPLHARLGI